MKSKNILPSGRSWASHKNHNKEREVSKLTSSHLLGYWIEWQIWDSYMKDWLCIQYNRLFQQKSICTNNCNDEDKNGDFLSSGSYPFCHFDRRILATNV
ncbi:hypothetical protein MA16_Dca011737 [Dendrobium catenatum]|uniref:Uncharacterized protein n=1 Tax=Dendrobium catenatum TaxID=906689 RepID=A0A2I0WEE7_9ASPA|nr:hypothetical protein MA16_Dca011737 [Dendrobium catenatum]